MVSIDDFKRETECLYKGEKYSVRDNGAVLRHPIEGKRPRPTDNQWTFGKPNEKNGYMHIGIERVHRIVAIAFIGEPPTPQHVVDHIDTNRRNNRPENLRWVTKLENALNNPITRKRIILACGSIEAFLANPSILNESDVEPDFRWMRTVSASEAQISRERLQSWAKSDKISSGGSLGEWIFNRTNTTAIPEEPALMMSLTPGAAQRIIFLNDKPSEYPCTPQEIGSDPLTTYANNLTSGAIFCRNHNGSFLVERSGVSKDCQSLYVMTKTAYVWRKQENDEYIPIPISELSKDDYSDNELHYSITEVIYKNGLFIHERTTTGFNSKEYIEELLTNSTQE